MWRQSIIVPRAIHVPGDRHRGRSCFIKIGTAQISHRAWARHCDHRAQRFRIMLRWKMPNYQDMLEVSSKRSRGGPVSEAQ
jgi:hypothetical protein